MGSKQSRLTDRLLQENLIQGLSLSDIGKIFGYSREYIRQRTQKLGINIKELRKKYPERYWPFNYCLFCDNKFITKVKKKRFCNETCVENFRKQASIIREKNILENKLFFERRYANIKGKTCIVARIIMEARLGRPLQSNEIVHHKDHNWRNNGAGNLIIMSASEHSRLHANLRHKGCKNKKVMV